MPPLSDSKLPLRDVLALDRTRLANDRTLLSWLRTAMMLLVSGVTMIKLFADSPALMVFGGALIPVAFVVAAIGIRRFSNTRREIQAALDVERGP